MPGIKTDMSYAELLMATLPRPIKTEQDAESIQRVIDMLIDKPSPLSEDERDFLVLLGALVALWEDGRYEFPDVPPHEIANALIEDNGLKQKDLVGPVFPTESVASEVLSGKRKLTYDFVGRLAEFFQVSPEIFYTVRDEQGAVLSKRAP